MEHPVVKALLISIEDDESGVVLMSIGGAEIAAMNYLGYKGPYPEVGTFFQPSFTCLFDDDVDENWDSVFNGNPHRQQALERTGLWSYRALGQVVSIETADHAALADCGGCLIPLPITMFNPDFIGEYVGFDIVRLNVWQA